MNRSSKSIFCFFCLLFSLAIIPVRSQSIDYAVKQLIKNSTFQSTYQLEPLLSARSRVMLEMSFNSAQFKDPVQVSVLKDKQIERVVLVYTTYALAEKFDQSKLNQSRLMALRAIIPAPFQNTYTSWRAIGQTGAISPESGRHFFHGFIIDYRESPSPELLLRESHFLDSLLKGASNTIEYEDRDRFSSIDNDSSILGKIDLKTSTVRLDRSISDDNLRFYLQPTLKSASVVQAFWLDSAHTELEMTEFIQDHKVKRRLKVNEEILIYKRSNASYLSLKNFGVLNSDSVILNSFRRNNWKNCVIVCDVTGSMSPYTGQLFVCMQELLLKGEIQGFVFFNDGDRKKTGQKKLGKTGGIYSYAGNCQDSMHQTALRCMSAGDGGDIPENYLEALLFAEEKFQSATNIVLIADNWSSPRDLQLYKRLNLPVHIVLCAAQNGVNTEFLKLAHLINGSVYTLQQDIPNLSKLKSNERITIGDEEFLFSGGEFILLTDELREKMR